MVPETQRDKEANSQIYPVLQKELDIIWLVLVKEKYDPNMIFTPYLTKKQKKELNRVAYKIHSNGAPSPPPQWRSYSEILEV